MISTPKAFPTEFCRDVVAVAVTARRRCRRSGRASGSASPAPHRWLSSPISKTG